MNRIPSIASRRVAAAPFLISPLVAALLVACGGGGGGSTTPAPTPVACATNCVSGVAASGKAIVGATVTLTDSTGTTRTATTAADGSYQIDSTGLVGPFLLKVAGTGGATFYSVSADANAKTTVNLTQLSDLVVRTWYGAQGIAADAAFAAPATNPAPPAAVLPSLAASVMNLVQLWLDKNNVPSGFNPISTVFAANGSGIDAVLDSASVSVTSPSAVTLTVIAGTTTQTTTLALGSGSVTATTTTSDSATGTQSSNVATTAVSAQSGTTLDAIKAGLGALASTVNTKGASLAAADLLAFVDPNLLDDGLNAAQFIAGLVGGLAGSTILFEVQNVTSVDVAGGLAEVKVLMTQTVGAQTGSETIVFRFKLIGSNWVFAGNGLAYRFDARAEMRTDSGANNGWNRCDGSPSGPGMSINVHVSTLANAFSGGTASGGGTIWPNASNGPSTACVATGTLASGSTFTESGIDFKDFFLNTGPIAPASLPPAGTPITVNLTPAAGGSPIPATAVLNAWTNDPVTFSAPVSSQLSSIAFGQPLQVAWTLPTSYAIRNVQLSALTFTGPSSDPNAQRCFADEQLLAKTATSGTVTIPATCNGLPVVQVNLNLSANGVNGERSHSNHSLN